MLTPKEASQVKEALIHCKRPFFFFHDDPDGFASFLICYKYIKEGKGMPVKAAPNVTEPFTRYVREYDADIVFVLDIAMVEQDFIDQVKVPVVWIDHHELQQRTKVSYFNPQKRGVNIPTPYLCHQAVQQDLWLTVIGCIGDWYFPNDLIKEFREKYPGIIPEDVKTVQDALYNSEAGTLVKVLSFNLKGTTTATRASITAMQKILSPNEILKQETKEGEFVWKRYLAIEKVYQKLYQQAMKAQTKDQIFIFLYPSDEHSLTKDLANELLYRLPNEIIIVGREKSGDLRCSIRSKKTNILNPVKKAITGLRATGGGHEHACGANINKEDFEQFVKNLRAEINA